MGSWPLVTLYTKNIFFSSDAMTFTLLEVLHNFPQAKENNTNDANLTLLPLEIMHCTHT